MREPKVIYWVDDLRNPDDFLKRDKGDTVVWIKDFSSFVSRINSMGLPDVVWFDHDLGEGKSGKDCADFLVDYCLDKGERLPEYNSQSQNPVGRENILGLLDSYNKFYLNNIENG